MSEVIPRIPVDASVLLPHRSPLPLAEVRAPLLPQNAFVVLLFQPPPLLNIPVGVHAVSRLPQGAPRASANFFPKRPACPGLTTSIPLPRHETGSENGERQVAFGRWQRTARTGGRTGSSRGL